MPYYMRTLNIFVLYMFLYAMSVCLQVAKDHAFLAVLWGFSLITHCLFEETCTSFLSRMVYHIAENFRKV